MILASFTCASWRSRHHLEQQVLIAWIMGFSVLGSIGAIAGAALLLAFHDVTRKKLVPYQVSFASGTLLCVARLAR